MLPVTILNGNHQTNQVVERHSPNTDHTEVPIIVADIAQSDLRPDDDLTFGNMRIPTASAYCKFAPKQTRFHIKRDKKHMLEKMLTLRQERKIIEVQLRTAA